MMPKLTNIMNRKIIKNLNGNFKKNNVAEMLNQDYIALRFHKLKATKHKILI